MTTDLRAPNGRHGVNELRGLAGAFAGATLCWMAWGLFASGDYFDAGNPLTMATLVVAGIVGAYAGFKAKARAARMILIAAVVLGLVFWVAAPDGWWASAPPARAAIP